MYDIRKGDIIVTVDGHILKVTKHSKSYLWGLDITDNCSFMSLRTEIDKRIKEVVYLWVKSMINGYHKDCE